ncbi:hypothetical protein [Pedobacter sp. KLB.chiD]|uniref:hypothetical protein n=1 Tax=Pedobacter sp. KLB.chiD TaxID=3387402 RepID=UPI00399A054E
MENEVANPWMKLFTVAIKDSKLNAWHISLLFAIAYLALLQKEKKVVHVSRSKLMMISHISTLPTYHKYFKQLQDFGYLRYTPSYHPACKSTIEIVKF